MPDFSSKTLRSFIALTVIVVGLIAALLWSQRAEEGMRVSGIVEADEIRLGSRVGGRVAKVHVQEGDTVSAGQTLVELEPFDLVHRLAESQAKLAQQQAELERLEVGFREEEIGQSKARVDQAQARLDLLLAGPRKQEIEAARARVQAALAQLELTQQSHQRARDLFQRNAATRAEYDEANQRLKESQSIRVVREKELELLEAGSRLEEIAEARGVLDQASQAWKLAVAGFRREDIAQARAAREATSAALASIQKQLDELSIKAPIDGTVESVELQKGDLVTAGAPALSMIDTRQLWIRAYVPGRANVQLDQPVRVTIDALPGITVPARVTYRSRQAEFTPSNVQTPEEREKQVFRIKVSLAEHHHDLWPGMTADVWIDPRKEE